MDSKKQGATLVRGADGSLYALSGDTCEVLKENLDQESGRGAETLRTAKDAGRAGLDQDHSSARAYVDPGDQLSARAYVDPGDQLSARAYVDPGDQLSARAYVDPGDQLSARAYVDPGDQRAVRAYVDPGDRTTG